ncbi:MAG: twin-arginine translocase TatA/TatE family subunit [Armatimonadetes bacterium]|nr:twin-arginine translocase TatA/TatE family subunit [Armatimonadota bacterium]
MPGPPEMIWILVILFLLFGAKKLPELARSSGEALKEFKKATKEAMADEEPVKPTVAQEAPRRMEAPADSNTTSTSA